MPEAPLNFLAKAYEVDVRDADLTAPGMSKAVFYISAESSLVAPSKVFLTLTDYLTDYLLSSL